MNSVVVGHGYYLRNHSATVGLLNGDISCRLCTNSPESAELILEYGALGIRSEDESFSERDNHGEQVDREPVGTTSWRST